MRNICSECLCEDVGETTKEDGMLLCSHCAEAQDLVLNEDTDEWMSK